MPRLTVPGTDAELSPATNPAFGRRSDGIWELVRPERRAAVERFATAYAAVRQAEGRALTPAEFRQLPFLDVEHPASAYWQARATSFKRLLPLLERSDTGLMLDIGAGSGWLAAHAAKRGWSAVAIDVMVQGPDSLAAARHHDVDLMLVQAEMEALPFEGGSVDLAIMNASLHYAGDVRHALEEAVRVVRVGGTLVVLDSPVFADPSAGEQMTADFAAQTAVNLGVCAAPLEGRGFVQRDELARFDFQRLGDSGPIQRIQRGFHRVRGAHRAGREVADRPTLVTIVRQHW